METASAGADTGSAAAPGARPQPGALRVLFMTEACERFGYYVMVSIFTLYLTESLKMPDSKAFLIFGAYYSYAFLATVAGGFAADRVLGFGWSIIIGAALMAAGYFVLALGSSATIYAALALLVVGMGFFKANVSALLGRFYDDNDPRRSVGFTIFYMGINVGAFLGSLLAGLIAREFGYGAAFAIAGAGKLLAIVFYRLGKRRIGNLDAPPATAQATPAWSILVFVLAAALLAASAILLARPEIAGVVLAVVGTLAVIFYVVLIFRQSGDVRRRLLVHLALVAAAVIFFAVYLQDNTSVLLFTDRDVTRTVFGWVVPAPEFASLNGAFILMLAPLLALLWPWLSGRGIHIGDLLKFVLGLAFIGIAYLLLDLGIFEAATGARTNFEWIVLFYFVLTTAELCLSPVGLSLTTELAPRHLSGIAMGIWFIGTAAANYLSGLLGQVADVPKGTGAAAEVAIYSHAFLVFGAIGLAAAVIFLALVPRLRRMAGLKAAL